MPLLHRLHVDVWIVAAEAVGSLIIVGYCVAAVLALLYRRGITAARLLVAEGAITGLGYKLAGTLLRTLLLLSWRQILMFAAILALRTLLKRFFVWEQGRLART
ncbi:MAG: DUF1622 domain-containing protein [Thermomicrobia bacterium]|nr:DUF1622 domain-containing protein [Thermomicrobia bacterium]